MIHLFRTTALVIGLVSTAATASAAEPFASFEPPLAYDSWSREEGASFDAARISEIVPPAASSSGVIPTNYFVPPAAPVSLPANGAPATICCGDGRCGWSMGTGAYFIQPRWSTNPAFYRGSGFIPAVLSETGFNWDMQGAPFVWLGYTAEQGLGFRAQWFNFDGHSARETLTVDGINTDAILTPVIGGIGSATNVTDDVFTVRSGLKMTVADIEVTKAFVYRRGQFLLSGGGRYAYVGQSYNSLIVDDVGAFVESLDAGHSSTLFGPTAAVQARFPSLNFPRLGYFGRVRGALLFGAGNRSAAMDSIATFPLRYVAESDVCIPVTELEVGFDWNRRFGRSVFFVQSGFTAQAWFGTGNAAASSTASFTPIDHSATDTSNLGLYGLKTSIGFNF
jgi:hypothetical protein